MIRDYAQKMRLFSPNMRLCLVLVVCFGFSFLGIYLVLLNLYLIRLGFGPEFIGLLWSIWGLVQALACFPAGLIAGRIGLRKTMIAGVCACIVGFAGIPLTEIMPSAAQGVWAMVMNALTGIGYALWVTAIGPFMIGATSEEERDHAFAVYFALVPLGAFFGSLVAGVLPGFFASAMGVSLDSPAPYRYPLLLAGLLTLPGLVAVFAAKENTPTAEATSSPAVAVPRTAMVAPTHRTTMGENSVTNDVIACRKAESLTRVRTKPVYSSFLSRKWSASLFSCVNACTTIIAPSRSVTSPDISASSAWALLVAARTRGLM